MQNPLPIYLDDQGWLTPCSTVHIAPSPNFDSRPKNTAISLLVIHNISLPPGQFGGPEVIDFFQNRLDIHSHPWLKRLTGVKVSAHFFIRRNGQIIQFVSCQHRAWHAGASFFQGKTQCNDFSIGIELEGSDYLNYEEAQYHALTALVPELCRVYQLKYSCGHEHIAPGRKTDPGPAFDWARLTKILPNPFI